MRGEDRRARGRAARWGAAAIAAGAAVGCLRIDPFRCQNDGDCVLDGQLGQCRIADQICIYPDASCATQWSAADGKCMSAVQGGSSDGSGTAGGSGEGSGSTTTPPGECGPGATMDITAEGSVWASSVFTEEFPATLAVDGDYTTSWLSAGLDLEGNPSVFEWTLGEPRCITQVVVVGNGMHADPQYREDYGFESMTMRVFDEDDAVVFQRMFNLAGTPDPDAVGSPEVVGVKVQLELFDHEIFVSGGFSELEVAGR